MRLNPSHTERRFCVTQEAHPPVCLEVRMRAALRSATRAVVVVLAAGVTACSEGNPGLTSPDEPRLLQAGSSETLATGLNLTNGSSVTWNVQMPSSGQILLSFDGRINYGSTAGNSTILEIEVNGYDVGSGLVNKGSTYTYPNRGGTESYYANRGSAWGQATSYWGLFWSPDFVQNNLSSNYYYVSGGQAYTYVLNVSGLIYYGQVNTITLRNQGQWVLNATGNSPTIVLRDVVVQAQ